MGWFRKMPNLEHVMNDPEALRESVERMMAHQGSRGEVRINHGIRTAQELEDWVRQSSPTPENIDAYRRLLGLDSDANV
ncbi:hypothetical protein DS843_26085 [Roseomonas genomospecies 6]|uniref:Uncharacterized protein n=2 Tax=Roseomonas genomospecies 6 TaxID=214106 RepID=A0A9W7KQP0_9PROT|nr:hypothetical protein DS843_26085 [Roseomonas genomospecies 6]